LFASTAFSSPYQDTGSNRQHSILLVILTFLLSFLLGSSHITKWNATDFQSVTSLADVDVFETDLKPYRSFALPLPGMSCRRWHGEKHLMGFGEAREDSFISIQSPFVAVTYDRYDMMRGRKESSFRPCFFCFSLSSTICKVNLISVPVWYLCTSDDGGLRYAYFCCLHFANVQPSSHATLW
jgi:hypothetical protein